MKCVVLNRKTPLRESREMRNRRGACSLQPSLIKADAFPEKLFQNHRLYLSHNSSILWRVGWTGNQCLPTAVPVLQWEEETSSSKSHTPCYGNVDSYSVAKADTCVPSPSNLSAHLGLSLGFYKT